MENETDIVNSVEVTSSDKPTMVNSSNLASKSIRFTNFMLDSVLAWIIYFSIRYILYSIGFGALFEQKDNPLLDLIKYLYWPFLYFLYYFTFEGLYQRTPAKLFTKTIIVDRYGRKPNISSIFVRSLLRLVPLEQFTFLGANSFGLHDSSSRTFVVYKIAILSNKLPKEEQDVTEKNEEKYPSKLLQEKIVSINENEIEMGKTQSNEEGKIGAIQTELVPFFKERAKSCSSKKDVIELFFIWVVSQGVLRTFVNPYDFDKFIDEYVESFFRFFITNNDKKEEILLPKVAFRRLFRKIYEGCSDIYTAIKDDGYILNEDN